MRKLAFLFLIILLTASCVAPAAMPGPAAQAPAPAGRRAAEGWQRTSATCRGSLRTRTTSSSGSRSTW